MTREPDRTFNIHAHAASVLWGVEPIDRTPQDWTRVGERRAEKRDQ